MTIEYDVIIIGAGAAGMISAIEAGKRGRKVLLVDHYKKIGEKIRISGGGRCNFTNVNTNPNKFLSQNPKFVRSADLTNFGFCERNLLGFVLTLVKLHLPPPEILIFSPIFL